MQTINILLFALIFPVLVTGLAESSEDGENLAVRNITELCPVKSVDEWCNPTNHKHKTCRNPEEYCYHYTEESNRELDDCRTCRDVCEDGFLVTPEDRPNCENKCSWYQYNKCLANIDDEFVLVPKKDFHDIQENLKNKDPPGWTISGGVAIGLFVALPLIGIIIGFVIGYYCRSRRVNVCIWCQPGSNRSDNRTVQHQQQLLVLQNQNNVANLANAAPGQNPGNPTHGENPGDAAHGRNPGNPANGENPANPTIGENPANPTHGRNPGNAAHGQNLTNLENGQNPANPTNGHNSSNSDHGQNAARPSSYQTPPNPAGIVNVQPPDMKQTPPYTAPPGGLSPDAGNAASERNVELPFPRQVSSQPSSQHPSSSPHLKYSPLPKTHFRPQTDGSSAGDSTTIPKRADDSSNDVPDPSTISTSESEARPLLEGPDDGKKPIQAEDKRREKPPYITQSAPSPQNSPKPHSTKN